MFPKSQPPLPLGKVVITVNAQTQIAQVMQADYGKTLQDLLHKHAMHDWGIVCREDWRTNDWAAHNGERVLSAYMIGDVKVWIITEADRSSTTILLPEEY